MIVANDEKVVRLACVPEQVNIPVDMVKSMRLDEKYNIRLDIVSVPEGTGRMLDMLERNEVDIAMTVSDAFIVANAKGREVELLGTWVSSPLVWAIASSPHFPTSVTDVASLLAYKQSLTLSTSATKLRVGISRPGSGSQTMAIYLAMLQGISPAQLEFVVADNFMGLKAAIASGEIDLFMWETFTTKPDFDANILRKIGDVPTPWPAFSLVVAKTIHRNNHNSNSNSKNDHKLLQNALFPALAEAAFHFISNTNVASERVVQSFAHRREDALAWLQSVEYNLDLSCSTHSPDVIAVNTGVNVRGNSLAIGSFSESSSFSGRSSSHSNCMQLALEEEQEEEQEANGIILGQDAHNNVHRDHHETVFNLHPIDTTVYEKSVEVLKMAGLVPVTFESEQLFSPFSARV